MVFCKFLFITAMFTQQTTSSYLNDKQVNYSDYPGSVLLGSKTYTRNF